MRTFKALLYGEEDELSHVMTFCAPLFTTHRTLSPPYAPPRFPVETWHDQTKVIPYCFQDRFVVSLPHSTWNSTGRSVVLGLFSFLRSVAVVFFSGDAETQFKIDICRLIEKFVRKGVLLFALKPTKQKGIEAKSAIPTSSRHQLLLVALRPAVEGYGNKTLTDSASVDFVALRPAAEDMKLSQPEETIWIRRLPGPANEKGIEAVYLHRSVRASYVPRTASRGSTF